MSKSGVIVGVIYSADNQESHESERLACYLGAHLAATGFCEKIHLVGITPPHLPLLDVSQMAKRRISYVPCDKGVGGKSLVAPAANIEFSYWDCLEHCHMLIVTVNPSDTKSLGTKLRDLLVIKNKIVVFSMQRGEITSSTLRDSIGAKGTAIIDCVVGFAVVPHPKTGDLVATTPTPSIGVQRLSKEIESVAIGPVNLLERTKISCQYRRALSPISFAMLVYETLYALNALTEGSLADTLHSRNHRLIYAAMIRESRKVLSVAAAKGGWSPDFSLVNSYVNIPILEFTLVLPNFLFYIIWYLLGFQLPGIPSPTLVDVNDGRRPVLAHSINELLALGSRRSIDMPICTAVIEKVKLLEKNRSTNKIFLKEVEAAVLSRPHDSVNELLYWLFRAVSVALLVVFIYWLFFHD